MLKIRCSALGQIMTNPKGKSHMDTYLEAANDLIASKNRYEGMKTKDGVNGIKLSKKITDLETILPTLNASKNIIKLSDTCKSYIIKLVKEDVFRFKSEISSKEMEKGTEVEQDSIDLYNSVYNTFYVKNEIRLDNEFINGECDIEADDKIIDIKSAWSLETFPCTPEDIDNKSYEWQLRGYMWLWGKQESEIAYCMVDTPLDLLKDWDNDDIHLVKEHDETLRVTVTKFKRDSDKEEQIKKRVLECRRFYNSYKQQLLTKN